MIENIYESTLELIKKQTKMVSNDAAYCMMERLVKLMGEHDWNRFVQGSLDWNIEQCEKHKVDDEDVFGAFFYSFHKSFRQGDIYNFEFSAIETKELIVLIKIPADINNTVGCMGLLIEHKISLKTGF